MLISRKIVSDLIDTKKGGKNALKKKKPYQRSLSYCTDLPWWFTLACGQILSDST